MRFPGFDLYKELGVSTGASNDEIKRAYRGLVKKYHPDINKQVGAEERFKRISLAYEVLADGAKRASYDAQTVSRRVVPPSYTSQRRTTQRRPMSYSFFETDPEKIIERMYRDVFGDNWREEMKKLGIDFEDLNKPPRTASAFHRHDPGKVKYYKYPQLDYTKFNYVIYFVVIVAVLYVLSQ